MGNNPSCHGMKLHAFAFVSQQFFTLIMSNTPLMYRRQPHIVVIRFLPQKKGIRALYVNISCWLHNAAHFLSCILFFGKPTFFSGWNLWCAIFRCLLAFIRRFDERVSSDCDMALHIYTRASYICHVSLTETRMMVVTPLSSSPLPLLIARFNCTDTQKRNAHTHTLTKSFHMWIDFILTQSNQRRMTCNEIFFSVCFCGAITHTHLGNQNDLMMIYVIFIGFETQGRWEKRTRAQTICNACEYILMEPV